MIQGHTLSPSQQRFLRDELHGLTLGATTQRANIYRAGLSESQRSPVHTTLRRALDDIAEKYETGVPEKTHLANIKLLSERVGLEHAEVLNGGRFRVGPAQKALNLFLKYLWCAGMIPTPPHCPFDQRIIALLPSSVRCAWTAVDDLDTYKRLVAAARELAGNIPLAEWELSAYNHVSNAGRRAI